MQKLPLKLFYFPTVIGLAGSLVAVAIFNFFIPYLTGTLWNNILSYNRSLGWIPLTEGAFIFIFVMLIFGALTVRFTRSECTSLEMTLVTGTYTALITGIITVGLMTLNQLHASGFIYSMFYLETVIPVLCSTIFLFALGAYIQYIAKPENRGVTNNRDSRWDYGTIFLWYVQLLLFLF